jgi:membrane protease YdiL (CAAX protease family)
MPENHKEIKSMEQRYPFWKPFFAIFLVGFVGVLSLLVIIYPQVDDLIVAQPELAELPPFLIAVLALINPLILLVIATVVGCLLAHRVGLVSLISEWAAFGKPLLSRLKPQLLLALVSGLVFSIVVLVLDAAFLPVLGEEFQAIEVGEVQLIPQLVMGMLYGGITEEILLRWGFMSLLVWLGWLVFNRSRPRPSRGVVWTAIVLSAILFGIGHLPALAALVPLTPMLIIRTVLLNAIGGFWFGWLFWRYNLEVAMVSHAAAHIGFFIARLIALAVN